jgi:hypothetical protein
MDGGSAIFLQAMFCKSFGKGKTFLASYLNFAVAKFVACRVVARRGVVLMRKMSASPEATARQSSLSAALGAKTGGKGITLPLVIRK